MSMKTSSNPTPARLSAPSTRLCSLNSSRSVNFLDIPPRKLGDRLVHPPQKRGKLARILMDPPLGKPQSLQMIQKRQRQLPIPQPSNNAPKPLHPQTIPVDIPPQPNSRRRTPFNAVGVKTDKLAPWAGFEPASGGRQPPMLGRATPPGRDLRHRQSIY